MMMDMSRQQGAFQDALQKARENPDYAAMRFSSSTLPDETQRFLLAKQIAEQRPLALLEHFERFSIASDADRYALACLCARGEPFFTVVNIAKFNISDEARRFRVLSLCADGDVEAIVRCFPTLGIAAPARQNALIAKCAQGNPGFVLEHLESLERAGLELKRMLGLCAQKNFTVARPYLEKFWPESLTSQAFVRTLFEGALKLHNLANLRELAAFALVQSGGEVSSREVKSKFVAMVGNWAVSHNDTAGGELLGWFADQDLLKAERLYRFFKHFSTDSVPFMKELTLSYGRHSTTAALSVLASCINKGEDIPLSDRILSKRLLSSKLGGFTKDIFLRYRDSSVHNPAQIEGLIREASSLMDRVVSLSSLSETDQTNPMLPLLVYSAYRPADLSVEEVANELSMLCDVELPEGILPLPAAGATIKVPKQTSSRVHRGQEIDYHTLAAMIENIVGITEPPVPESAFWDRLFNVPPGESPSDLTSFMISGALHLSRDGVLTDVADELQELLEQEKTANWAREVIGLLTELYEILLPDVIFQAWSKRAIADPGEILAHDITARVRGAFRESLISLDAELSKIDVVKGEAEVSEFLAFTPTVAHSFFSRAGARLCSANDMSSWLDENFLQVVLVDPKRGRMVGNIQLHVFQNSADHRSLLARINPNPEIVRRYDGAALAHQLVDLLRGLAKQNLMELYMPEQGEWHACTNRTELYPHLRKYMGTEESVALEVIEGHVMNKVYRVSEA
jgi:hypothetical protein